MHQTELTDFQGTTDGPGQGSDRADARTDGVDVRTDSVDDTDGRASGRHAHSSSVDEEVVWGVEPSPTRVAVPDGDEVATAAALLRDLRR